MHQHRPIFATRADSESCRRRSRSRSGRTGSCAGRHSLGRARRSPPIPAGRRRAWGRCVTFFEQRLGIAAGRGIATHGCLFQSSNEVLDKLPVLRIVELLLDDLLGRGDRHVDRLFPELKACRTHFALQLAFGLLQELPGPVARVRLQLTGDGLAPLTASCIFSRSRLLISAILASNEARRVSASRSSFSAASKSDWIFSRLASSIASRGPQAYFLAPKKIRKATMFVSRSAMMSPRWRP